MKPRISTTMTRTFPITTTPEFASGSAPGSAKTPAMLPAVLLATLALGGCVSNSTRDATLADNSIEQPPRSVSAREYGFVRPAIDPQTLARNPSFFGHHADLGQPTAGSSRPRAASAGMLGDPWQRINSGPGLGIPSHPRVAESLKPLTRNKAYLSQLATRARPYLALILTELERGGIPTELALLPEIESRYNPRAVSPMSAAGMWQFMPYTGKRMGLAQNASYDARLDVLASTRGAVKYLRELNRTFNGDWALTLAAYNCGPACVQAAQRRNERAGKATDYWSLDLPRETENYVPKLLAVISMVQNPQRYGQRLPSLPATSPLAAIPTRAPVDLAVAARTSGIPANTLAKLNPALKKGRNRPGQTAYLLVPATATARISQHLRQFGASATLAANKGASGRES